MSCLEVVLLMGFAGAFAALTASMKRLTEEGRCDKESH